MTVIQAAESQQVTAGPSRRLNLSGFNPLRNSRSMRNRSAQSQVHNVVEKDDFSDIDEEIDCLSPPPKNDAISYKTASRAFDKDDFDHSDSEEDEFRFSTLKLKHLRRHHHRLSRTGSAPRQAKADKGKLTVVLDLDETLIHSQISPKSAYGKCAQDSAKVSSETDKYQCDSFEITLADGELVRVMKRPGLDEFLLSCAGKYELMAYTAGLRQYAEPLLNWLDPQGTIFRHRLYRDSCLFAGGYYVKDLWKIGRPLRRTVLVDNNLCCFLPQLSNGIPISSFYDDPSDDALSVLKNFLESLETEPDVRHSLTKHFNLVQSLGNTRDALLA